MPNKMSEERRGQIALLFLKAKMRRDGIRIKADMRREVGNEAKEIGVGVDEAMWFLEEMVGELLTEAFKHRVPMQSQK